MCGNGRCMCMKVKEWSSVEREGIETLSGISEKVGHCGELTLRCR